MITNERQKTTHSSQFLDQRARSPSGHEDAFPPHRPKAGYVIGKETVAWVRGSGRDAPFAVVRGNRDRTASQKQHSTALTALRVLGIKNELEFARP